MTQEDGWNKMTRKRHEPLSVWTPFGVTRIDFDPPEADRSWRRIRVKVGPMNTVLKREGVKPQALPMLVDDDGRPTFHLLKPEVDDDGKLIGFKEVEQTLKLAAPVGE
jgi:hypothetical protein